MVYHKKKTSIFIALLFLITTFVSMQIPSAAVGIQPVANAGGPYFGEECNSMLLNASSSYDSEDDLLTYRWNIDGSWIENSNYPYLEWIWYDDFFGTITLEVSDGTNITTDTTDVTISNIPPQILSIEGATEVDVDSEIHFAVNFFDGMPDPRSRTASFDTFTMTYSWGDGSTTELSLATEEFSVSASHVYLEKGLYQIIITILDGDGGEAIAEWEVKVGEIPLVEAGPDGLVDEGSLFRSQGFLADSESQTYTAFVDYYDDTGSLPLMLNPGNTFDLHHIYSDDGVYPILVSVFNDGMEYGEDTAVITVLNVPPTFDSLTISPTDAVYLSDLVQISGVFSDPGMFDLHTVMIDWGDGSSTTDSLEAGVFSISSTHRYQNAGDYQIIVSILDDDGGSCQESLSIVVKTPSTSLDTLKTLIASLKIPRGLKNNLFFFLEKVPSLLKHHRIYATIHQLQAFIHYIQAHSGKYLPRDQARELIQVTQLVIESLRTR